ncbi:hypothetical protein [Flaviflagellibacter deserti]|uniref:Uncharacterized protein n=1 Tax=Flaviflagellibacter deserti TaxID=2267266 RepID=A0ABV9Z4F7_9HYPH
MAKANVNDRDSIELIYDQSVFEHDAARNARGESAVVHGLNILSAPDGNGTIEIARASRHIAERDPEGDSVFIAAYRARATTADDANAYAGSISPSSEAVNDNGDYGRFINEVLETVRNTKFKPAIGVGDDRIKGFRGG